MIICICNSLNEEQIQDAISQGCETSQDIFKFFDKTADCTTCEEDIELIAKSDENLHSG